MGPTKVRLNGVDISNLCQQQNLQRVRTVLSLTARRRRSSSGWNSAAIFQATNALVVLDDCAASNDMKGRTGQLVSLGFSARHAGISVWVLTQQIISIAKPFRENVAAIVLQTGWTKLHVPVRGGGLGGQHAKKVVSDSPGLVDFVIGLVNSVINLADGQVTFFWERRTVKSVYSSKRFWG